MTAPAMNSDSPEETTATANQRWTTADGSSWWLRESHFNQPSGDYGANCYFGLTTIPADADSVTFDDNECNYHSKSYYCQPTQFDLTPKAGSPEGCTCTRSFLAKGHHYSAEILIRCEGCLDVYRAQDENSCPTGTKIFSPRSRADWETFIASAKPLRAPHWIVDVTRPENGCEGCTDVAMNSETAHGWVTSDGSSWWLRDSAYTQPSGDYTANCFMDLWQNPINGETVTFDDRDCEVHSTSYYCQPVLKPAPTPAPAPPAAEPASEGGCDLADLKAGMIVKMNKGDAEDAEHVVPEGVTGTIACFTSHGRPGICFSDWNDGHSNVDSCSTDFAQSTTACTGTNMWFSRTEYLECTEALNAPASNATSTGETAGNSTAM